MTDSYEVISHSEEETRRAGFLLAERLVASDLVLLSGDLGSGKTVFVRGLAEGLGADPGEVSSPTFALVHEYGPDGHQPVLLHVDLYRLASDERGLSELGIEEGRAGGAVVAIEWPRPPFVRDEAWRVEILETGGGARQIRIAGPRVQLRMLP